MSYKLVHGKNGPTLSLDKTGSFINIITCKQITNFYSYFSDNWYYNPLLLSIKNDSLKSKTISWWTCKNSKYIKKTGKYDFQVKF